MPQAFSRISTLLKPISLLLWSGWLMSAQAQSPIDSLQHLLQTDLPPASRLDVLNELSIQYLSRDMDSAFSYSRSAMEVARKINNDTLSFFTYRTFAFLAIKSERKLEEAEQYIREILQINRERMPSAKREGSTLIYLGYILELRGKTEEALEAYLGAEPLLIEVEAWGNLSDLYNNIAQSYSMNEEPQLAASFYRKSLKVLEKEDNPRSRANTLQNLALVTAKHDSAILLLQQARELLAQGPLNPNSLGINSEILAGKYLQIEDYPPAARHYKEAYSSFRQSGYEQGMGRVAQQMALTFGRLGQNDSSQKYLSLSLPYLENLPSQIEKKIGYGNLAEASAEAGNYELAYEFLSKARIAQDSVAAQSSREALATSSIRLETLEKERTIAQQNLDLAQAASTRNQLLLGGGLLIALIAAVYQWYLSQQRKRKQEAELALSHEQAEASRLRELDQFKTQFFANLSHELRTPLTLILGPVADLKDSIKSLANREKLGIVQQNANRLLTLVNEIMDLSKAEVGKLSLQTSPADLSALVKRNFAAFESMAELKQIDYRLTLDLPDTHVLTDYPKLEKILQNLLSNALKFTPTGGKVGFRVHQDESIFRFEVADSGSGIAPEDLPHVFDRFFQAKHSKLPLQGGTGIGLALARELARLLGGDITVNSQVGVGTQFQLSVPMEVVEAATTLVDPVTEEEAVETESAHTVSFAPLSLQGEKPRILVVEDNHDLGKYLVQILSDQYQCVWVRDGVAGLAQLQQSSFEAILSDVMMPNMDGFEFRAKVNERQEWRQIPFIILTARHLESDRLHGLQLGIDDYLTKPFSTLELKARLQNLIQNKREREAFLRETIDPMKEQETEQNQDLLMLQQLEETVLVNLDNPQFGVADLAEAANYSSKQLGRIIKKQTGMTTVKFILEIRLQKARELLENRRVSAVFDAQVLVGIQSNAYFAKKFAERFGVAPSDMFKR